MLPLQAVFGNPALMAKAYYDRLSALMAGIAPNLSVKADLEIKHFFSGAALYADGRICITLTPAGFGLKLPEDLRSELMQEEDVQPLRYFPKAPIKKAHIVLPERMLEDKETLCLLVEKSINYVLALP